MLLAGSGMTQITLNIFEKKEQTHKVKHVGMIYYCYNHILQRDTQIDAEFHANQGIQPLFKNDLMKKSWDSWLHLPSHWQAPSKEVM